MSRASQLGFTVAAIVVWSMMFWFGVVDMQHPEYRWYTSAIVAFVGLTLIYIGRDVWRLESPKTNNSEAEEI